MRAIERHVMEAKQLKAIENIKRAVDVNDSDTLSMLSEDGQVLWTASGCWTGSRNVTLGDLRAIAAIAPPVAAGSVGRTKLHDMTLPDTETRDWYFDCDGHYIDVELRKDGHYSIYFRNRAEGGKGWLDTGVLIERAEKAEARVRELSLNLLVAQGETDAALARVKELEARFVTVAHHPV